MPRHTLPHQLEDWANQKGAANALFAQEPSGYRPITWADYWRLAREFAKAIIKNGHQVGDAVAIMGNNRYEWVIAELGTMTAGGIPAPIYPTSTPDQIKHILANSGARFVVAELDEHIERILPHANGGPVEHVIRMTKGDTSGPVVHFDDFVASGRDGDDAALDARLAGIGPQDTGLFIYTSGTTGVSKGAELTHEGLVAMGQMLEDALPDITAFDIKTVSYLPLSHIAEQIFTNFVHLLRGGEVYFCDDLKKVKDALAVVRPTIFVGVPRVWEKFEAALRARFAEATGVKAKLAGWALKTELESFQRTIETGNEVSSFSRNMANKLVISKVKAALGLDRLRIAASGAAPISRGTLDFFASIGIPIHEGYGMTETTGLLTAAPFGRPRFGSVGKVLPGIDLKIADDGEIIARGKNMTKGYFKMPEKTAELLDEDGWLHTGDLGRLDEDGFVHITGRKKDLIITAGGKNVAPSEMEQHLSQIPGVGQAVVVGDRKPYLVALLALDPEALAPLCEAAGVAVTDIATLAKDDKVRAFIEKQIESVCNAKVARYQTIKKFEVLPQPFSVETGEMTPSLKVKRNVVNARYEGVVEQLYAS
ncbi:MAG: long-chain fatty acid--CoA ligase [Deltaproteobacteria bacterium]